MRISIQEGLFPAKDFATFLSIAGECGFDAVEVWGHGLSRRMSEVKSALSATGTPVCAICPGGEGIRGSLLSGDREKRDAALQDILGFLEMGAELGGAGLVYVPEFGVEKFMKLRPDASDFDHRKDTFLSVFEPVAARAAELGTPVYLEPLNRYEAYFLIHVGQAAELCRLIDIPEVRILADLFHMNIEEGDIAETIEECGEWIGHVHLVDSNRLAPGLGHLDLRGAIEALKRSGYTGALSMECAIAGDPSETLKEAVGLTREML